MTEEEFIVLNSIKQVMELIDPDVFIDEDSTGNHVDCDGILIYIHDNKIVMESYTNLEVSNPLSDPIIFDKILNMYLGLKLRSDIRAQILGVAWKEP